MKISEREILLLQDALGNSSLSLKYLHSKITSTVSEEIILDVLRIGQTLTKTAESVLKTHKPLSFSRR